MILSIHVRLKPLRVYLTYPACSVPLHCPVMATTATAQSAASHQSLTMLNKASARSGATFEVYSPDAA